MPGLRSTRPRPQLIAVGALAVLTLAACGDEPATPTPAPSEPVSTVEADIDEIQQDVDEIQHDVDEIQEDVDEIQEDIEEEHLQHKP